MPTTVEAAEGSGGFEIDAAALFQLGFDPEDVGRALINTRGDARRALEQLSEQQRQRGSSSMDSEPSNAEETCDDVDNDELALAIKMSLEAPPSRVRDVNSLWNPPRYMPSSGLHGARCKTLSLVEEVEVRDGGYAWQKAQAFMDTGNQHMTIVDSRFAQRHAIYIPDDASAILGVARRSSWGQAERWTTLHGVVPGASSRAPCVTIALKVRGEEFLIQAAVSQMTGHDLLIGVDVLRRLFASGFKIDSGSI